jgi:ATP-dependent RNA helicase DeaD
MKGKDVILQAQTGSGKTLAYSLPLLAKIDPTRAAIQAVVIVPTRELSFQVVGVLRQLVSSSPDKIAIMSVMEGSNNNRFSNFYSAFLFLNNVLC